jgi:plastocyanin
MLQPPRVHQMGIAMKRFALLLAIGLLAVSVPASAQTQTAQQTPSRASKKLRELVIGGEGNTYGVNQKDFELIAGQGYRWPITSNGGVEYKFHTTLFRNVWMNQIVINDLEVHMNGAPAWLEFDGKGTMMVQFTTVRPGEYEWWIEGLEDKGMKGKIVIK